VCPGHYELADATRADAAELVALDERNFAPSDRFSRRMWRTILNDARMLTLMARDEGTLIGAIAGEFQPRAGRVVVWSIGVDEPYRGTGLAQQLLAELLRRTPPGCTFVRLDARRDNARARRFYERLGFQKEREIHAAYADGTDAIRYGISREQLLLTTALR
jgi:ribosomal protein S18 acetylase RimI-like enzyme